MVNEASVVAHTSLVDLIPAISIPTHHDIYPFNTVGHKPHKLADRHSSLESATSEEAIVFAVLASRHLDRGPHAARHCCQNGETFAPVVFEVLGLSFTTVEAHKSISGIYAARILAGPTVVDGAPFEMLECEVRIPLPVCGGQGYRLLFAIHDPIMRMVVVSSLCTHSDRIKQLPPTWMQGVGSDFKRHLDPLQPLQQTIVKPNVVLAGAVDARSCENKRDPSTGILDVFVPAPDYHSVAKRFLRPAQCGACFSERCHSGLGR